MPAAHTAFPIYHKSFSLALLDFDILPFTSEFTSRGFTAVTLDGRTCLSKISTMFPLSEKGTSSNVPTVQKMFSDMGGPTLSCFKLDAACCDNIVEDRGQ